MAVFEERAPAFQLYARNWSLRTCEYGFLGRGVLIELMVRCWNNGSIPVEPRFVADAIGMPVEQFMEVWPRIAHEFTAEGAPAGRLIHPDMEEQRAFQAKKRSDNSEKGKKSGEARRRKSGTEGEPNANSGSTAVQPQFNSGSLPVGTGDEPNTNTATTTATAFEEEREKARAHEQVGPTTTPPLALVPPPQPARTCDRSAKGTVLAALALHAKALAPPASLINAVCSIGERAAAANPAIDPDDYARRYVETYAVWRTKFTSQPAWSADALERHAATVQRITDSIDPMPEWNAPLRSQSQQATTSSGKPRGRAPVADFTAFPTGEQR